MGKHDKRRDERSPSPARRHYRRGSDDEPRFERAKDRKDHERRRSQERSRDRDEKDENSDSAKERKKREKKERSRKKKDESGVKNYSREDADRRPLEEHHGRKPGYGMHSRLETQSYGYADSQMPHPPRPEYGHAYEGGSYGYPPPQGGSYYSGAGYAPTPSDPTSSAAMSPPPNYASRPFQGYPPPPEGSAHFPQGGATYYGKRSETQHAAREYSPSGTPSGSYRPPAQYGDYGHSGGAHVQPGYQGPYMDSSWQPPMSTVDGSAAFPGYAPPPKQTYSASQAYGDSSFSESYNPQHHSSAQAQTSLGEGIEPAKYESSGKVQAASALETFADGLGAALHSCARTLFPATSTHRPLKPGDSGVPEKVTGNRFESFADVKGWNRVKWYVDGKDYMYAVSVALEKAQKSIWILDWWLSPELYLRRPPKFNENYRIDRMLKAAAERGVKVNIIVYKEVPQALTLASVHTKHALEELHHNIAVFRHPDHLPDRKTIADDVFKKISEGNYTLGDGLKGLYGMKDDIVLYWAHHEKLCLVDSEIAFMGGLDLCFGRWDMNHHPIADVHPSDLREILFPGQDFNNARVMDFHTVDQWDQNQLSRSSSARMGWSDVALSISGGVVEDLKRHFTERWNYIYREKYDVRKDIRYSLLDESWMKGGEGHRRRVLKETAKTAGKKVKRGRHEHHEIEDGNEGNYDRIEGVECQIVRSCSKWSHGTDTTEHSICNAYCQIISVAEHFIYIENQFFITATNDAQSPIINKIGDSIVQRVIRADEKGEKFRIIVCIPSVPAFPGDLRDEGSLGTRAIMEFQYRSICRDRGYSIMEQIAKAGIDPKKYIRFYNLRSYDRINISASHAAGEEKSGVSYEAAAAAHDKEVGGGQDRMDIRGDEYARYQSKAPQAGGEWDSVARCAMLGGGSIIQVPWEGDPDKEIEHFVSEELYIHSKLLIADDRYVICGSANLNDRSQLGDHDSEIAIIIADPTALPTTMNSLPYTASHFAATLRRQIFRKHLGLIPAQNLSHVDENMLPVPHPNIYDFDSIADRLVADPLSDELWDHWNRTAKTNTEVFRKVFRPVPDDTVTNWKGYDEFYGKVFAPQGEGRDKKEPEEKWGHVVRRNFSPGAKGAQEVKQELAKVRGHLVEMPLEFLREEDIAVEGVALNALTETIYT